MRGPARTRSEIRSYLYSQVVGLLAYGVDYDTAVDLVAGEIGSTPEKVRAVLERSWATSSA